MKISPQMLLTSALAVSAAIVIGCSNETQTTVSESGESAPATREMISAAKTESVNLNVSGMT